MGTRALSIHDGSGRKTKSLEAASRSQVPLSSFFTKKSSLEPELSIHQQFHPPYDHCFGGGSFHTYSTNCSHGRRYLTCRIGTHFSFRLRSRFGRICSSKSVCDESFSTCQKGRSHKSRNHLDFERCREPLLLQQLPKFRPCCSSYVSGQRYCSRSETGS